MKFPLINISETIWKSEDAMEYVLYDEFFYSGDQFVFERYVYNKLFCDCNGVIFKVVGRVPPSEWWRKALSFLPNVYKEKLTFIKTDRTMGLDELKDYLIQRVNDLSDNKFKWKWIELLQKSKSYEELINGEAK
jgi:hypothetical protein